MPSSEIPPKAATTTMKEQLSTSSTEESKYPSHQVSKMHQSEKFFLSQMPSSEIPPKAATTTMKEQLSTSSTEESKCPSHHVPKMDQNVFLTTRNRLLCLFIGTGMAWVLYVTGLVVYTTVSGTVFWPFVMPAGPCNGSLENTSGGGSVSAFPSTWSPSTLPSSASSSAALTSSPSPLSAFASSASPASLPSSSPSASSLSSSLPPSTSTASPTSTSFPEWPHDRMMALMVIAMVALNLCMTWWAILAARTNRCPKCLLINLGFGFAGSISACFVVSTCVLSWPDYLRLMGCLTADADLYGTLCFAFSYVLLLVSSIFFVLLIIAVGFSLLPDHTRKFAVSSNH